MGNVSSFIDDAARGFIEAQHVFFVASAPLDAAGHVNLSPKGLDTFRILSPEKVAYLDLTGSGAETVAHVRENGRIVLMFCAFEKVPKILRIHGHGRAVEPSQPGFALLHALFPAYEGVRAVIVIENLRVSDSCGFGVPILKFAQDRTQLPDWGRKKGAAGLEEYRAKKNRLSIDGLPAVSG